MHSFKHILCFVALVASAATVSAVPTPSPVSKRSILTIDGIVDSFPPSTSTVSARSAEVLARSFNGKMTNAKRLALGLPLNPPTRKQTGRRNGDYHRRDPTPSGTPPPPMPTTKTGTILVTDANTNAPLGYVSENTGNNNHFGITTDIASGIHFSFTLPDSTAAQTSTLDITATDTSYAAQWPLMGGIDGVVNISDDLGPGSSNFAYIQGTTATPPNSPPSAVSNSYPSAEDSESAIWVYNSVTQAITARWINTDSSSPATYIAFVSGSNAFVITGDVNTFESSFATSSEVHFTFVPSA